jgi:RNA polymerase primary sigma factor
MDIRGTGQTVKVAVTAEAPGRSRLDRMVRLLAAHVSGSAVTTRDIDSVFSITAADAPERAAVMAVLEAVGIHVTAPDRQAPDNSHPSVGAATVDGEQRSLPPTETATVAAQRVLLLDRERRKPWNRLLTADEEVGLALLLRAPHLAPHDELPPGYRKTLDDSSEAAAAFDALLLHNLRLVWSHARTCPQERLDFDDLAQSAIFGLIRAVEKFDPTLGNKFSTYAMWWIRQSTSRALMNEARTIRIPVHMLERVNRILHARALIETSGRRAGLQELCEATDLSPSEVAEGLRLSVDAVSLDTPVDGASGPPLSEFVRTHGGPDPADVVDQGALRTVIDQALSGLPPRESLILRLRAGFDRDEPQTLDEIGQLLGVTRERVRQLESRALSRILGILDNLGISYTKRATESKQTTSN